jgi:hypothetical protein
MASKYSNDQLDKLIAAYEEARRRLAGESPMPSWNELPLGMKDAFIAVFYAGRKSALDEMGK